MAESIREYGIKYRVIKLEKEKYLLFPVKLVRGEDKAEGFQTEEELLSHANEKDDYKNRYVVDMIFARDELEYVYDFDEDEEFLLDYFFDDYKDTVFFVDTSQQEDFITRNEINLRTINDQGSDITYYMDKSIPQMILNEKALNELSQAESLEEVKLILTKYKHLLSSLKEFHASKGVTKINVVNGKIDSLEVNRKVEGGNREVEEEKKIKKVPTSILGKVSSSTGDVSYQGLRDYLKERIYGHEEELDTFAQKLYMNYTAKKGEPVESILLVGPTGTGKTETVKAACEYLDIPTIEANASNIVPQGIKGMSIEDVITELYERAGHDIDRAERGLIFLDEFDKLNDSDMDLKASVKNILLTFTAGGTFPIDNDRYTFTFDSSMTNKVYAGVFERISERQKQVGFRSNQERITRLGAEEEIRRKIMEKKYFTLEELTRISTILGYNELDRETKRQILRNSKLSEFAKKRERYKRQFGIDLLAEDSYIEAILDQIEEQETGMRSVNNLLKRTMNPAERAILEGQEKGYKRLILTRDTVEDFKKFDLS